MINETQMQFAATQNVSPMGLIKLSKPILDLIWEEVNEIKQDFENHASQLATSNLAGHLEREYDLVKNKDRIGEMLVPYIMRYANSTSSVGDILSSIVDSNDPKTLSKNTDKQVAHKYTFNIRDLWVNYQKKGEYNPLHQHTGAFSFVIWLQSPYIIEEEEALFNTTKQSEAKFEYVYINDLGRPQTMSIPVDRKMDGVMGIFPSTTLHQVYPFYSSDDYRISVAGNAYFDIAKYEMIVK
jgi:hypothetical protein